MEEAYILPHVFVRCRNIVHIGEAGYIYALRSDSYTTKPLSEECYAIYDTAKRYEAELSVAVSSIRYALSVQMAGGKLYQYL